jgi:hypothetical protein
MFSPADFDHLSSAELKSLVLKLLEEVAVLRRTVAAQRDEIARLKGGRVDAKGLVAVVGPDRGLLRSALYRAVRSTTVLTSSKRRPWTAYGFGSSFNEAKHAAGIADKDLHFHDFARHGRYQVLHCGPSDRRDRGNSGMERRSS